MKTPRFLNLLPLACATVLCLAGPAAAETTSQAAAKSDANTGAKTANARRAATGPGTQTEDDIYVGVTKKNPTKARKRTKDCGKDCDDLEVERARRR
jgi:hypothetical protein